MSLSVGGTIKMVRNDVPTRQTLSVACTTRTRLSTPTWNHYHTVFTADDNLLITPLSYSGRSLNFRNTVIGHAIDGLPTAAVPYRLIMLSQIPLSRGGPYHAQCPVVGSSARTSFVRFVPFNSSIAVNNRRTRTADRVDYRSRRVRHIRGGTTTAAQQSYGPSYRTDSNFTGPDGEPFRKYYLLVFRKHFSTLIRGPRRGPSG